MSPNRFPDWSASNNQNCFRVKLVIYMSSVVFQEKPSETRKNSTAVFVSLFWSWNRTVIFLSNFRMEFKVLLRVVTIEKNERGLNSPPPPSSQLKSTNNRLKTQFFFCEIN